MSHHGGLVETCPDNAFSPDFILLLNTPPEIMLVIFFFVRLEMLPTLLGLPQCSKNKRIYTLPPIVKALQADHHEVLCRLVERTMTNPIPDTDCDSCTDHNLPRTVTYSEGLLWNPLKYHLVAML